MQIGLQMYTVRNAFAADPFGTLEKVAAAGFRHIEMANHRAEYDPGTGTGLPLEEFRAKLADLGISLIGAHFMPSDPKLIGSFYEDTTKVDRVIEYYSKAGAKHLSMPVDFFPSRDYLLQRCELYNDIGRRCKDAGLTFLYHNHYHEFQRFDGEFMLDIIAENTDPETVAIELDAYWTFRGALNPVEKIREYGSRIKVIHEKDFPLDQVQHLNAWQMLDQDVPVDYDGFLETFKPSHFIEVGDGIIKIQDVIDAGNEFDIPLILIEQDHTKLDEIESINRSMANFKRMRGLEFAV